MKPFIVTIGAHSFGCVATDRAAAYAKFVDLAGGERFAVAPVGESFAVLVQRHAAEAARLREAIAC